MSITQYKIIRHMKKQENVTHTQKKGQWIETKPERTHLLELADIATMIPICLKM